MFGISKLIDFLVPDVPEALELKIKRERYLAKQALADTDTLMKVGVTSAFSFYVIQQWQGEIWQDCKFSFAVCNTVLVN